MPDLQEILALSMVALVAVLYLWRRRVRKMRGSGGCGNCAFAAPPKKEAPVHFYRRRK